MLQNNCFIVSVHPLSYGGTWEVAKYSGSCQVLEKLELHSAIAFCDSYASPKLSNLLRASITRRMHTNHGPIVVKLQIKHLYLDWKRSSGWLEAWEGLLLVTDILRTCAEAIFRVTWLWRWLPHRLSKCHSLTVLLRTPITQMIFFNQRTLPGFKPFSYERS